MVIGHRGAPGYLPEHTRAAYALAFAMGVDAVEPDVVVSRDGVLVVRHENEISGTTDVADRPEFADRRTTKTIDGERVTGWFAEDLDWAELATLRARERLPELRPASAAHDGEEPILRLRDVLDLAAGAGRGVVVEIKHATFFASIGWDIAELVADELRSSGFDGPLWIESFEASVLDRVRARGIPASYVYLLEASGAPVDDPSTPYAEVMTAAGIDALVGRVDGISVDKAVLLRPHPSVVADAHARGLQVFTWTCRPENRFLERRFRLPGAAAALGDYRSEWGVIRSLGVDAVFVDHPDLGVAFFSPQN
ncbi:glycerophosphodiester phosphodiesterase family protein [Microbacterium sp. ASV49]|uniref:glycerophosphodiester phosphodiesterase n=1 Tax=Microbacterium candidum TaxID=3041922 RepID=A0ABT7MX82_9MICO|nr:glycerophosphodiester phosphodiesterase family protein [Microbacterium sp. ASV49]MDL9979052.1 glycerophosphodiester phosphodiesterase family protein [Microbacterium sp. ASV49]